MSRARHVALVALLLGLGGGAFSVLYAKPPVAQYFYLIAQKNRKEVPPHYEPLTFADFLALPALPAEYTAADWAVVLTHTRRSVSVEGYIAEVIPVPDGMTYGRPPLKGDLHLHLREVRQPRCFPWGPQGGQLVTEVTPPFQPPTTGWSFETLLDLCRRQVRVRLSGWLLHDFEHIPGVGIWRASAWEIHPITQIEVWDPEQRSWRSFL